MNHHKTYTHTGRVSLCKFQQPVINQCKDVSVRRQGHKWTKYWVVSLLFICAIQLLLICDLAPRGHVFILADEGLLKLPVRNASCVLIFIIIRAKFYFLVVNEVKLRHIYFILQWSQELLVSAKYNETN